MVHGLYTVMESTWKDKTYPKHLNSREKRLFVLVERAIDLERAKGVHVTNAWAAPAQCADTAQLSPGNSRLEKLPYMEEVTRLVLKIDQVL